MWLWSASVMAIRFRPCFARGRGPVMDQERIAHGHGLNADEAPSWNDLAWPFEMKRINHQEAYSLDGACTNWAESYFSRLRRAETGHHHHIAGPYLLRYAQEASWREDNRRVTNGEQRRASRAPRPEAASRAWISPDTGSGMWSSSQDYAKPALSGEYRTASCCRHHRSRLCRNARQSLDCIEIEPFASPMEWRIVW